MQVYALTNDAQEEAKDDFDDQIQKVTDRMQRHCILEIMGD